MKTAFSRKNRLGAFAVLAVALLMAAALVPMAVEDSDAETKTSTINLPPGKTYKWTPTFTSGLSPIITVLSSEDSMPADGASGFATTSGTNDAAHGYASVSADGMVVVKIGSNYTKSDFYVKVRAVTTNPDQTVYYGIDFKTTAITLDYGVDSVTLKVGEKIADMTPTLSIGSAVSYSIAAGTTALTAATFKERTGLDFNTSSGKISGTPTKYSAQQDYTITATVSTGSSTNLKATDTISIGTFENLTDSSYKVYAIVNGTELNVPGYEGPDGTVIETMAVTMQKDSGTASSVTAGTATSGMTVAVGTGAITGKPSSAGTYVFTQTFTASAATGGSTSTRTITIVAENQVALGGASTGNSFVGHEDTATVTKTAGPDVTWSKVSVTDANGTAVSSTVDDTFTVADGVITSSAATPAGTYKVTVAAVSGTSASGINADYGTTPSTNAATKVVTFTVNERNSLGAATVYTNTELTAWTGATMTAGVASDYTIDYNSSGVTNGSITIDNNGLVSKGATGLSEGTYTLKVTATDRLNADNTATADLIVKVVGVLAFTNTPTAGAITD